MGTVCDADPRRGGGHVGGDGVGAGEELEGHGHDRHAGEGVEDEVHPLAPPHGRPPARGRADHPAAAATARRRPSPSRPRRWPTAASNSSSPASPASRLSSSSWGGAGGRGGAGVATIAAGRMGGGGAGTTGTSGGEATAASAFGGMAAGGTMTTPGSSGDGAGAASTIAAAATGTPPSGRRDSSPVGRPSVVAPAGGGGGSGASGTGGRRSDGNGGSTSRARAIAVRAEIGVVVRWIGIGGVGRDLRWSRCGDLRRRGLVDGRGGCWRRLPERQRHRPQHEIVVVLVEDRFGGTDRLRNRISLRRDGGHRIGPRSRRFGRWHGGGPVDRDRRCYRNRRLGHPSRRCDRRRRCRLGRGRWRFEGRHGSGPVDRDGGLLPPVRLNRRDHRHRGRARVVRHRGRGGRRRLAPTGPGGSAAGSGRRLDRRRRRLPVGQPRPGIVGRRHRPLARNVLAHLPRRYRRTGGPDPRVTPGSGSSPRRPHFASTG